MRQFINEVNEMAAHILESGGVVYHANNSKDVSLKERPVTSDFQSMGVWFSSDPKYAKMFGRKLHTLPIPKGRFYKPKDHRFASVFFDKDLAEKLYGKKIAKILSVYAKAWPESPRRKSYWQDEWDDYIDEGEFEKYLKNIGIPYKGSTSGPEPFRQLIYSNKDYVQLFKWKYETKYDGILFKNSKIDINTPHDVYVIFDPSKIKNW